MSQSVPIMFYPRLLRRVRAALIDSMVFLAVFAAWMMLLPTIVESHYLVKAGTLVMPLLALDPIAVAYTGGTVGHHVMGLRIRDATYEKNIGILRALLRELLRVGLGWLSLIFVLITRNHQALHDIATSTVVLLRRPETLPSREQLLARSDDTAKYRFPSKARRITFIVLYVILALTICLLFADFVVSDACLIYEQCNKYENNILAILDLLLTFAICAIILLGWKGLLFGCRRVPVERVLEQ